MLFLVHLVEVERLEARVRLILDITKHRAITGIPKITAAHFWKITLRITLRLQIGALVCCLQVWQRYDCLSR